MIRSAQQWSIALENFDALTNFSQRVGPRRGTSADQLAAAAHLSMWTIRAFADMYCSSTLKDVVLMFLNENTDGIRCVYSTVKHIPKILCFCYKYWVVENVLTVFLVRWL